MDNPLKIIADALIAAGMIFIVIGLAMAVIALLT